VHENDVHDVVRDIAGGLVEEVKQVSDSALELLYSRLTSWWLF
jgi:hypothetical protein